MRTILRISLLVACVGLSACETRVNVGATANASARYSSVLVTVKEVWVDERATAAPDDGDWLKFPLSEPRTLELVDIDNAAMSDLATDLKVATGTYGQIRLFLVDRVEPLTESAKAAGATFNDQVTFFDANGVESTLPLELPDAARGIGIETELVVPIPKDAVVATLAAASNGGSSSSSGLLLGTTLSDATQTSTTAPAPTLSTPTFTVPTTPTFTVPTVPGATAPTIGVPTVTSPGMPPGVIAPGVTTPVVTPSVPVGTSLPGTTPSPLLPGTVPGIVPTPTTTPGIVAPTPSPTPSASNSGTAGVPSRTVTVTSSVFFDAARDLVPFRFGDRLGFVLNPSLVAFDLDKVGSIQSQVDVASLPLDASSARPDVEVTAERLDEDAGRRVEVASAPVRADGSFTLYPLPIDGNAGDTTTYDLVIHGPAVTTVVIRGVPATKGAPGAGAEVALGAITLVASDAFFTNVAPGSTVAPRAARIRFYQTLADDPSPFLIDERPVDPLTGSFAADEALSASPVIVYGTFASTFSLIAAAPLEGAARYSVAAFAPLYGNGGFSSAPVAPPATAGTASAFTVAEIPIPPAAASGTITANVTAPTPGKYDNGALLVTHDGAIVTAASLAGALAGGQASAVSVAGVPASASSQFERGLYYLEAWAWSSADPAGSFTRQPVAAAVDLRAASTASAEVTVN